MLPTTVAWERCRNRLAALTVLALLGLTGPAGTTAVPTAEPTIAWTGGPMTQ